MHCALAAFQVTKLGVDGRVTGEKFDSQPEREKKVKSGRRRR